MNYSFPLLYDVLLWSRVILISYMQWVVSLFFQIGYFKITSGKSLLAIAEPILPDVPVTSTFNFSPCLLTLGELKLVFYFVTLLIKP
jgi:hypothetical protein